MRTYEELQAHVNAQIARYRDELFALNTWIHDKKELSCREFETSERVVEYLRSKGFTAEYPFAGIETAFFASHVNALDKKHLSSEIKPQLNIF